MGIVLNCEYDTNNETELFPRPKILSFFLKMDSFRPHLKYYANCLQS